MNQSLENLTTSCKGCTFSVYTGNEQTGCYVQEMGEDEFFPAYEDGLEYRVYKRACHFKRNAEWSTGDREADAAKLREEVKIKYNVFIETSQIFDNFGQALRTINKQTLQPEKIVGVDFNRQGDINYGIMSMSKLKAPWVFHEFLEIPTDWRDNVMTQFKSQFYVFISPPVSLPADYFETLSNKINYENLRFGCLEGDGILIFPNGLYTLRPKPIREILKEIEQLGLKRLDYENFSTKLPG